MAADGSIFAVAASPRVNGSSDRLLDAFLEGLAPLGLPVTKIYLDRLDITPCRSCGRCSRTGFCAQEDDMALIYRELATARAMILASPVHFMSVTAQAKTMIDRCQAIWVAKYRLKHPIHPHMRPGAFIATAGQASPRMFECPVRVVAAFFATTEFRLSEKLLEGGLDGYDADLGEKMLERAGLVGRRFAKRLSAGKGTRGET